MTLHSEWSSSKGVGLFKLSKDSGQNSRDRIPFVATESTMQFTYILTGSLSRCSHVSKVMVFVNTVIRSQHAIRVCNYYLYDATLQMGNESLGNTRATL